MRLDIRSLLSKPEQRRRLIVEASIAIQAREGRDTTVEEMNAVYDTLRNRCSHKIMPDRKEGKE